MADGTGVKKLTIFGSVNHLAHNYEMLKLAKKYPVKFCYLENNVRRWSRVSHRPEPTTWLTPDEFEWVTHYEPGKYDLAILHVDQQHVDGNIGKAQLYRALNQVITDIPKIVVNHGTPMNDDWDDDITINGGEVHTNRGLKRIKGMRELIGDNFMIVNSYEAVDRWGWGYPLIHGIDPDEWLDLGKEIRVTIPLSPGGLNKYYNRQLITAIKSEVKQKTGIDIIHTNVNYQVQDWQDLKELLGTSLITIHPYKDSPMPRSRTESMLSGSCVLSSKYHGAADFIEHGVDGLIVPDNPYSYADAIHYLVNDCYKEAVEMGQKGKEKAKKLFNLDRYHKELYTIITQVAEGKKPKWDGKKLW